MSKIGDELRGFTNTYDLNSLQIYELKRIADHIDAEHERAMADAELAAAPTEAQMEEWGYVKLPTDADGVPIHVGDVMEWCDSCKYGNPTGFGCTWDAHMRELGIEVGA